MTRLENLASMTSQQMAELLRQTGGTLLLDAPQLMVVEQEVCHHENGDLVDNRVTFVPRGPEGAWASIRQGVFDTAMEALWLQRTVPEAKIASPLVDFDRARVKGNPEHTSSGSAPLTALTAREAMNSLCD